MRTLALIPVLSALLLITAFSPTTAQTPNPALVGYWQNWNDAACPRIQLTEIDNRYNVICIAFALPAAGTDYDMVFVPEGSSVA